MGENRIARDLPLSHCYESVRAFRIVDGAGEVDLRSIARHAFEDIRSEELEYVLRFEEALVHPDA